MAITGIDTIEGKQIIAAGAVSAKSAEMAYNDENGNPITGYQVAGDYYSASNPSGFITGVDLTPYQLTADMTGYLTTADSANFYTTANESGFISEVPAGTMNESEFEYNGSNRITGYNGSAFSQGGGADLDFGYDESGAISSINTSALSDSRAGTPLYVESPLFTGQSGDSAYIGSDINETVLWTGTGSTTGSTINLSESLNNFERYGLYYYIPYQETNQTYYQELVYKSGQTVFGIKTDGINSTIWRQYMDYGTMTETSISIVSGRQGGFWLTGTDRAFNLYDGSDRHHYFTKVVGINRKRV